MSGAADEQAQVTAIIAALNAALAPKVAYDIEKVPSPRTGPYVEVTVVWRFGGESRNDGYVGTDGGRILTRYVAKHIEDARLMRSKVVGVLRYGRITVAGDVLITSRETGEPIGEDEGWFSGLDTWTFTA